MIFTKHDERNTNILAEEYNVMYYVVQKVGCSTMKAQFVEILKMPKTSRFPKDVHDVKKYPFPKLRKDEHLTTYGDYLRFAIIRNPWERLVSCYKDKIRDYHEEGGFFLQYGTTFYNQMPFEEFVKAVAEIPDSRADYHFCQQLYMLINVRGEFLPNYLFDLKNMSEHLDKIKSKTGIPFQVQTRLNSTKKSDYKSFYTPELIEIVRKRFIGDVEFFGYEFDKKKESFPSGFLSKEKIESLEYQGFMMTILKNKNIELIRVLRRTTKRYLAQKERGVFRKVKAFLSRS